MRCAAISFNRARRALRSGQELSRSRRPQHHRQHHRRDHTRGRRQCETAPERPAARGLKLRKRRVTRLIQARADPAIDA